jgi:sulfur dioxygenase
VLLRQLLDPESSTWTYLIADPVHREAVLIDPVREQVERDLQLLAELGLRLVATLETHVHADHVTGAWLLKLRTDSAIVYPAASGVTGADRLVAHGEAVRVGNVALEARSTPGHTDGCTTWVTGDCRMAFTGDAVLIRGCGRTDFQQGDARRLYRSVADHIFSLPDTTLLYPGHDYRGRTVTTVAEERRHNPRLGGGRTEDSFVALMAELKLAAPKKIAEAVPANLALGRLPGDPDPSPVPAWAPISRSATGAPRVTLDWVAAHLGQFRLVDVRQPEEFDGPLGHLPGSELLPLDQIEAGTAGWDRLAPVVLVCRSGGRSERAAVLLEQAGFQRVVSMSGGMAAWAERDLGRQG